MATSFGLRVYGGLFAFPLSLWSEAQEFRHSHCGFLHRDAGQCRCFLFGRGAEEENPGNQLVVEEGQWILWFCFDAGAGDVAVFHVADGQMRRLFQ